MKTNDDKLFCKHHILSDNIRGTCSKVSLPAYQRIQIWTLWHRNYGCNFERSISEIIVDVLTICLQNIADVVFT